MSRKLKNQVPQSFCGNKSNPHKMLLQIVFDILAEKLKQGQGRRFLPLLFIRPQKYRDKKRFPAQAYHAEYALFNFSRPFPAKAQILLL